MNEIQKQSANLKSWFALYTKPKSEFKAAAQIESIGVSYYLPSITKVKQWSDRKKKITEPLLRGYIFIYADEKERLMSLEQYSVVRCLFERGRPAKVPDWQIENLRNMLKNKTDFLISDRLIPGVKVKIKGGPFEGVIGTIQDAEGGKTLSVSIDLLNRSVIAHLSKESVFEVIKEN